MQRLRIIGLIVVGKDAATVITSLPGFIGLGNMGKHKADIAIKFAEDPEFVRTVLLKPRNLENSF